MSKSRKKRYYEDDYEDDYEDYESKKDLQNRRKEKKMKNDLRSKNFDYVREEE